MKKKIRIKSTVYASGAHKGSIGRKYMKTLKGGPNHIGGQ